MKTKDITICSFFIVLFIISSKIIIPAGLIPITLQTCSLIMAAIILNPKQIWISYGMYLLMGLIGLPVFANGGGIAYILQPSFGFLLSFPVAASFIAILKKRYTLDTFKTLFPICLLAILIVYTIGCLYMYGILNFYMGAQKNIAAIIAMGASPFIISDSISSALGCICALRLAHVASFQHIFTHN